MAYSKVEQYALEIFKEAFLLQIKDDLRSLIEFDLDDLLDSYLFIEENYLVFKRAKSLDECIKMFRRWVRCYLWQSALDEMPESEEEIAAQQAVDNNAARIKAEEIVYAHDPVPPSMAVAVLSKH